MVVADDDGGIGQVEHSLAVGVIGVQGDQLVIGGSVGNDDIHIRPDGDELLVSVNNATYGPYPSTLQMVVYGQHGDDDIHVAGSIVQTCWLYGGDGDDRIKGGGGDDVILGGSGDDLLLGKSGRDLLIGGRGADRIVGNHDDDITIAGFTVYDRKMSALNQILEIWSDQTLGYLQRVELLDGDGESDHVAGVALNRTTIAADGMKDVLTGASGDDWFLFHADEDRATDLRDEVFADDLDWMKSDE